MTINPYESPLTAGQAPLRNVGRAKWTLFKVLAVIGGLVLLAVLLLPNVRFAEPASRRMQCGNNLKQIALALHNYHEAHGELPPAYTVDAEGKPLHSWRTLILPFMEQQALYEKIDLSKPWDDSVNKVAFETSIQHYRCPSANLPETHTAYLAIVAPGGCFRPTQPRKFSEITDDTELTLMVMEFDATRAVHWMSPTDATEVDVMSFGTAAKLPHPNGAMAATAAGSVLYLSAKTKPETLRALISIAGNDDAIANTR